jgi:predicted Fe-Mo cluster-binding NifX family protein
VKKKMKKIAAVTDDGKTISPHFGRATKYAVVTVEAGHVIAHELREKAGHRDFQHQGSHDHDHHDHEQGRGFGNYAGEKHRIMFESIVDCEILLARGMGKGAYQGAIERGIGPILTDIADIDVAIQSVIDGSIENNPKRLH